jgi:hypothetical protein
MGEVIAAEWPMSTAAVGRDSESALGAAGFLSAAGQICWPPVQAIRTYTRGKTPLIGVKSPAMQASNLRERNEQNEFQAAGKNAESS